MPRRCQLTGKSVRFGRNVSHSHRKTQRRFQPNLQRVSLLSETLGRALPMQVSTAALKTVQRRGGLDAYLLSTPDEKLPLEGLRLKRQVRRARRRRSGARVADAG